MNNFENIASYIEYTLLKPGVTHAELESFLKEAKEANFAGVCVNPFFVSAARDALPSSIKVVTVVAFPIGDLPLAMRIEQTIHALALGADEIDTVLNLTLVKDKKWNRIVNELTVWREEVNRYKRCVLKVIIETGLLEKEEIFNTSLAVADSGVDFIKTSTGFLSRGVELEDVQIIKRAVGSRVSIKASGGVRTLQQTVRLIKAGASRVGTSKGWKIYQESKNS